MVIQSCPVDTANVHPRKPCSIVSIRLSIPLYSLSKPLSSNFNVRLFSVTIRTTCSGVPSGMSTSISRVSLTLAPITPDK